MTSLPTNGQSMDTYEVTRRARSAGFESFSEFPQEMGERLWKLLGLGVYIHSNNPSPAIAQWLQTIWKPKVAAITTFACNFRDIYKDQLFWTALPSYLKRIAAEIQANVPAGVDPEDIGLRKLCGYLCFDLFVLRKREGVWEVEAIRSEEEVGLPVIVGEEDGKMLYLYHRGWYAAEDSSFPLYFQPPKTQINFSGFVNAGKSWKDVASVSHKMVDTLLRFLLQESLQPSLPDYLEPLQQACAEYTAYSLTVGLPACESLERMRQNYSDESHPLGLCERFRLVDTYVKIPTCEHRFHESCLNYYFSTQSQEVRLCPTCSTPIPSSLSQPTVASLSEPMSPANEWCYCQRCNHISSYREIVAHQAHDIHYICVRCLYGLSVCPLCGLELPSQIVTWVQQAVELLSSSPSS